MIKGLKLIGIVLLFIMFVQLMTVLQSGRLPQGSARQAEDMAAKEQRFFQELRDKMVETQLIQRGIKDEKVLQAMKTVPRHEFVPSPVAAAAYDDSPLPIGEGQTISQPYVVAYMTEQLGLKGTEKVLEIGTGSGYQAAVLGALAEQVYSIEIIEQLARGAERNLQRTGFKNVHVRQGDGYFGWPEMAPFDAIIVTAAPPELPAQLFEQLKPGGKIIAPVGVSHQELRLITKNFDGSRIEKKLIPVLFVPMTGEVQKQGE